VKVVPFEAGQEKNSASPKNMNPPPAKKN